MKRGLNAAIFATLLMGTAQAQPMHTSVITQTEWDAYRASFIAADGRIVDTGNSNVSHSEGQGYGLLLSVLAGDRATFESVWTFTQTELLVRDDGLAAWRWEADHEPHVTDVNNATDGDILIAYALALAGEAWHDAGKTEKATALVEAIGKTMLVDASGLTVILPGTQGFSAADREDGPVVNPSYWVFEAFPVFASLTAEIDWKGISSDGLKLLERTRFEPAGLPSDWVSLGGKNPQPAKGFPPEFGYNNIRIPLYLLRAGMGPEALVPFRAIGDHNGLSRIDVTSGEVLERLTEPGYRLIEAALVCTLDGTPVSAGMQTFAPTSYYAATLQLLGLDYLRRHQENCLNGEGQP